ncbi:MAG: 50S ribosomal protein L28 [Elusimicrobiota bacterium]|jgi:large subunit ribosomal protein L28
MALRCVVCGKGPVAGKSISHSHKTSNRRFLPNVHKVKVLLNGRPQRVKVCSRCLRSRKVSKVGPRQLSAA